MFSTILASHLLIDIVSIVRSYSSWHAHFANDKYKFVFIWQYDERPECFVSWRQTKINTGKDKGKEIHAHIWNSCWTSPIHEHQVGLWRAVVGHDYIAEGNDDAILDIPSNLCIYNWHDATKVCDVQNLRWDPFDDSNGNWIEVVGCHNGLITACGITQKTLYYFDLFEQFWRYKGQLTTVNGARLFAANTTHVLFVDILSNELIMHNLTTNLTFLMKVCSLRECKLRLCDSVAAFSSFDSDLCFLCARGYSDSSPAFTIVNVTARRVYFHECTPFSSSHDRGFVNCGVV
jgi:hypothetical protein